MKAFSEAYDRASVDPEFRARLKSDPKSVLKEIGCDIPDTVEVVVLEDTASTAHIILPTNTWPDPPSVGELDRLQRHPNSGVCNDSHSSVGCCYTDPAEGKP